MSRLMYWIINYEPEWEAVSKELKQLAEHAGQQFDTHIRSFNYRHRALRLRGRERHYPLPHGILFLPIFGNSWSHDIVNHLFASAGERILTPMLAGDQSILTVAKGTHSLSSFERNLSTLKKFRFIVVESEWDKQILQQGGIASGSMKLIYPGVEVKPYKQVPGRLRLLFASSPFGRYDFLGRGLYLILEAARQLPDVEFLIIWRERHVDRMRSLVAERGLSNVKIRSAYVPEMSQVYDSVHGTIVMALESNSLKPCPHSALESLAHGKPIVASSRTSLATVVRDNECGVCCEPNTEAFLTAIQRLRDNYATYQTRCHEVVRQMFSPEVFRRKYMSIYRDVAGRSC